MIQISFHDKRLNFTVVLATILWVVLMTTCKEPSEFEPDDPYTDPPDPPVFVLPLPDTTLNGYFVPVIFDWTDVAGAENYEIQFDTNTTFPTDSIHQVNAPPTTISFRRYGTVTIYCYRIRALSSSWQDGHTVWSATRRFYLRPDP